MLSFLSEFLFIDCRQRTDGSEHWGSVVLDRGWMSSETVVLAPPRDIQHVAAESPALLVYLIDHSTSSPTEPAQGFILAGGFTKSATEICPRSPTSVAHSLRASPNVCRTFSISFRSGSLCICFLTHMPHLQFRHSLSLKMPYTHLLLKEHVFLFPTYQHLLQH